jgi:hypothetical protein
MPHKKIHKELDRTRARQLAKAHLVGVLFWSVDNTLTHKWASLELKASSFEDVTNGELRLLRSLYKEEVYKLLGVVFPNC